MDIEELGWNAIGFATTLFARMLATLALHRPDGEPALSFLSIEPPTPTPNQPRCTI